MGAKPKRLPSGEAVRHDPIIVTGANWALEKSGLEGRGVQVDSIASILNFPQIFFQNQVGKAQKILI